MGGAIYYHRLREDGTLLDQVNFAIMLTDTANHPGTTDPSKDADELLENFVFSGEADKSLEDTLAAFETPDTQTLVA